MTNLYTMAIRVFISSTRQDLDECRNAAINAIHLCEGASSVNMENRVAGYNYSVQECCNMINDSTHYIGIIAFRRGWVPEENNPEQKSITEIEFDYAQTRIQRERIGVFLPDPPISEKLREVAQQQSNFEAEAQQAFRERIRSNGFYMTFRDTETLSAKVAIQLCKWIEQKNLRAMTRSTHFSENNNSANNSRKMARPSENMIQLGRETHVEQFENSLCELQTSSLKAACFLIHGLGGNGHEEMMQRLCQVLTQKQYIQPAYCHYSVAMDVTWRRNSLAELLELIGREIIRTSNLPDWVPPHSPEELAHRFQEVLETKDIILEIQGIQRLHPIDPLPVFIKKFWHPFIAALHHSTPHQLIVLLGLKVTIRQEWKSMVQGPPTSDPDTVIDLSRPIELPELKSFTKEELTAWFRQWLPLNKAVERSQSLMNETEGHPQTLYGILRNDGTTWG